jgi:hypothetical protein
VVPVEVERDMEFIGWRVWLPTALNVKPDIHVAHRQFGSRLGLFDTCPCVERTHRTATT